MKSIALQKTYKDFVALPEVGWPTLVSAVLHIAVFIFAIVGLPQIADRNDIYLASDEMVMDVELFDNSGIIKDEQTIKEEEDAPLPPAKPVYNNTDSVPNLTQPKQPDIKDESKNTAKDQGVAVPDPTLIKVPPKPTAKPKPKPLESKPGNTEEVTQPERSITSVLKDITPVDWNNAEEMINSDDKNTGGTTQAGNAGRQMTSSDLVALNQGVQPCWNLNAGGRYAENLIVKLNVTVNPDRTVRDVKIVEQMRYATDQHYKSAADAARWALLNPQCSTLNLPPEKYETWKNFVYVFDPSQML